MMKKLLSKIFNFFKKNWKCLLKSFSLLFIITYSACLFGANVGYYKYDVAVKKFFPKINFGIDIVGGNQLTAVIDSTDVINEFYNTTIEDINSICKEQKLSCKINRLNDKNNKIEIEFKTNNKKQIIAEFRKIFNNYGLPVDIVSNNNNNLKLVITFSKKILDKIISDTTDKAITILKNRIDAIGVKEINIQRYGFDKIVILIPQGSNIERIKNIINTTARLTFNLMDSHHIFYEKPKKIMKDRIIVEQYKPQNSNTLYYLVEQKPSLNGDCITNVQVANNGFDIAINFKMNRTGAIKFAETTKNNIGRLLAIILDDKVIMAPMINVAILDGNGSITGHFTIEEANDLSILLRSGSLPAKIKIIDDRQLSSVFDKNIFSNIQKSFFIAILIVSIIMLIRYRYLGFIAMSALILNFIFSIAIVSLFGFTLTLPGIAGIILMIGMALDANILIYERMKELKKQGIIQTGILINKGFSNALSTIIDSNLTTIIAAIALFSFGGSFIKGFSITLIIGILCSLFTAVNFSKIIITQNYLKIRHKALPL